MLGFSKLIRFLPANIKTLIAFTGIFVAGLDAIFTFATMSAMHVVIACIVMFLTVIGTLPALSVQENVAMFIAACASIVTAIGVLTPWVLCSWFPKEEGLCSCVDDDTVIRLVALMAAFVLACIAYALTP